MYDVSFIENLRDYLYQKTGKSYFKNIRDGKEDILCTCPIHKEGQERHPSCGFSKIPKKDAPAGMFHCFNCGFTGDIYYVLKTLLGNKYDEKEAKSRLNLEDIEFNSRLEYRPPLFIIPEIPKYINKSELKQYRYYPDYLKERNITESTANKYDIGYDTKTFEITFPIRDKYGHILDIGRRSVVGKRYEYSKGFVKPLYGVFELSDIMTEFYVWIVEGPFNLWSLYQYKKKGVALLGTGTQRQLEQLLTLKCKGFVLALDGDDAGRKGIQKIATFLKHNNRFVYVAYVPNGMDINDMTEEQFNQMEVGTYKKWLNDMTFRGLIKNT